MRRHLVRSVPAWIVLLACAGTGGLADAQTATPPPPAGPAAAEPATPPAGLVIDGIRLSAQVQGGILLNPSRPSDGLNFGHSFTDRANQPQLNQVLLTAQRELPTDAAGFAWGFKIQVLYGSDARYTHFLGEFDRAFGERRNQVDVVEANLQLHLPYLAAGGLDLKAGQYPTPLGYETIDPSTNPFYSHSYIFNFGLPFKHTGILTTTHVTPEADVYLGIDSGTNTFLGGAGDNNGAAAFITGFGLKLLEGKLSILALTHIGPEQPSRLLSPAGFNANGYYRYYNDVAATYKPNESWTFVTEVNLVRDDFAKANGFGAAQYVSYALNDTVTLNGRAEIWRDDNNFFVAGFRNNLDPVRALGGYPLAGAVSLASRPTTYGEITLGFTYKPALPAPVAALMIRPEIRWDHAFTNSRPFNGGRDNDAFTIGSDFVISF